MKNSLRRKFNTFPAVLVTAGLLLCGCDNPAVTGDGTVSVAVSGDPAAAGNGVSGAPIVLGESYGVSEYPVTVNGVAITASPQKVICLSSSLTEMIYELGFGDRLIGRGSYCDYPEQVTALPDLGRPTAPDLEAVRAADPDLLITATSIPAKDVAALSESGIDVLYISSPHSTDELGRIYCALGMVFEGQFDGEDDGNAVFLGITSKLSSSGISIGTFVYVTEDLAIAGGDTFESSVLSYFGTNAAGDASGYGFDKSGLADIQPDTVILSGEVSLEALSADNVLGSLDAVTTGNVITVDNSYFESPSGRITGIVGEIAGTEE